MRSAVQGLPQWWHHDSRRCACMWARPRPSALSHDPLAGRWFVFARKKMKKQLGAKRWQVLGVLSLLSPLSFSFSPSLSPPLSLSSSLSLSLSLSSFLSLTQSLSVKGHTQKNCRVNTHPYGGPTDFASNCIHLGGWDSWSIVTVESTHNPPEPPKASPLPENWRHASRTMINHQELEHDDDDRTHNCTGTETWTARKSSDTIPNTRDVLRPISRTVGCWRFSSLWERHRIKCWTTTKSMPGKKIARKRPGSRCEADLALRTARALPPPFLLWLVAYCTFSTPPCQAGPVHGNTLHTKNEKNSIYVQTLDQTCTLRMTLKFSTNEHQRET